MTENIKVSISISFIDQHEGTGTICRTKYIANTNVRKFFSFFFFFFFFNNFFFLIRILIENYNLRIRMFANMGPGIVIKTCEYTEYSGFYTETELTCQSLKLEAGVSKTKIATTLKFELKFLIQMELHVSDYFSGKIS